METRGPQFQVVDDRYRDEPDEAPELFQELLAGRTVFLPGVENSTVTTMYSRLMARYSRRLRRRSRSVDGVDGFVVWLDPADPEASHQEPER